MYDYGTVYYEGCKQARRCHKLGTITYKCGKSWCFLEFKYYKTWEDN